MNTNYTSRLLLQTKKNKGFSLLEMIVVISIVGLLIAVLSGFIVSSIYGNTKAEILKEVRQNGSYALSTIEGIIINSRNIVCSDDGLSLTAYDIDGNSSILLCDNQGGKISSNSANLTGAKVSIASCSFVCTPNPPVVGKPTRVDVNFLIGQVGNLNLKPSEKASLEFKGTIITKNY